MKPYDEAMIGKLVRFTTSEGLKQGKILEGEFSSGFGREFLGYTVWAESERVNYVRVKQHENGSWEMIPVKLTGS